MNVWELRMAMKNLPDDMRVFVDGYEGGLDNPMLTEPRNVDLNVDVGSSVYGPHALEGEGYWGPKPEKTVRAVILTRYPPKGDR